MKFFHPVFHNFVSLGMKLINHSLIIVEEVFVHHSFSVSILVIQIIFFWFWMLLTITKTHLFLHQIKSNGLSLRFSKLTYYIVDKSGRARERVKVKINVWNKRLDFVVYTQSKHIYVNVSFSQVTKAAIIAGCCVRVLTTISEKPTHLFLSCTLYIFP